jgi:hypothetical protein
LPQASNENPRRFRVIWPLATSLDNNLDNHALLPLSYPFISTPIRIA